MRQVNQRRVRIILSFLAVGLIVSVLVVRSNRLGPPRSRDAVPSPAAREDPHPSSPQPPKPPGNIIPASPPDLEKNSHASIPETLANLIVPVAGVQPNQLHDTFSEARSAGRMHDAIDIPAPKGTPVLAVADGAIVKLFHSDRGGTTIYQSSTDKKFIYYYAHLDRYAEALTEGQTVKQGETIAFVGDTGNAGAGNYHLHFSIAIVTDPKRYWEGTNINPYPLLKK